LAGFDLRQKTLGYAGCLRKAGLGQASLLAPESERGFCLQKLIKFALAQNGFGAALDLFDGAARGLRIFPILARLDQPIIFLAGVEKSISD
jgi:hypothetical protein